MSRFQSASSGLVESRLFVHSDPWGKETELLDRSDSSCTGKELARPPQEDNHMEQLMERTPLMSLPQGFETTCKVQSFDCWQRKQEYHYWETHSRVQT